MQNTDALTRLALDLSRSWTHLADERHRSLVAFLEQVTLFEDQERLEIRRLAGLRVGPARH